VNLPTTLGRILAVALAATLSVAEAGAPAPAAPEPAPAAPALGVGSVLRPQYTLADGKPLAAGTAFVVEVDGVVSVVTAHHLFGPTGGLPAQIEADALPRAVTSARYVDAWTGARVGADLVPVRVPGARPMGQDAVGDLAVFRLPNSFDRIASGTVAPFAALTLSATEPKVGDPVWLAAPVVGSTVQLHPARVGEVKPGWLFYDFAQAGLDLTATSGAPVLDARGQVVAIHLGGGTADGVSFGAAAPAASVRANLKAAVGP